MKNELDSAEARWLFLTLALMLAVAGFTTDWESWQEWRRDWTTMMISGVALAILGVVIAVMKRYVRKDEDDDEGRKRGPDSLFDVLHRYRGALQGALEEAPVRRERPRIAQEADGGG